MKEVSVRTAATALLFAATAGTAFAGGSGCLYSQAKSTLAENEVSPVERIVIDERDPTLLALLKEQDAAEQTLPVVQN